MTREITTCAFACNSFRNCETRAPTPLRVGRPPAHCSASGRTVQGRRVGEWHGQLMVSRDADGCRSVGTEELTVAAEGRHDGREARLGVPGGDPEGGSVGEPWVPPRSSTCCDIAERPRCREQLARLEQRLQPGEDHRPTAVELVVRTLAQLVVRHDEPAGVADGLDHPGDA
jgi:hypothetical protein